MNNKKIKIIFIILILIWMVTVFTFSHQPATESSETSGNTIRIIINIFTDIANLTETEKDEMVANLQPIVRKLAHFSIYTLGGILIFGYLNTYDIKIKNKILYSFLFGATYAVTDEIHQLFIEGRSGEFRDVCIDSSGILVGIFICLMLIKLKNLILYINKNGKD